MAGRGRGRGMSSLSLTQDQLQVLGVTRQDNATHVSPSVPPPLFPTLLTKPLPLTSDATTDYMLIVKDQFIEYLHESPAYVKAKTRTDGVERYSDKYKILAQESKKDKILDCNWANMPTELKPHVGRVRVARKRKLDDPADIDKRLQTLEKKETLEGDEIVGVNEDEAAAKKGDDDDDIEDEEHEQEDEVDDGTDYANNYFDNGEDFDEEDDNLDDGPVY